MGRGLTGARRFGQAAGILQLLALPPELPAAELQLSLSDEFDEPSSIADWKLHHEEEGWPAQTVTLDIDATSTGHLTIEPEVSSWYEDYRGVYIYKEVSGDFTALTRVLATGLAGGVPQSNFTLAGLMVRAPRSPSPAGWQPGRENWLFVNTGANGGGPFVETKTTRNSVSTLRLIPTRTGWVELRIERAGPAFTLARKFDDGDWETLELFQRPDLPAAVQVGLDAYTDWDTLWGLFGGDPLGFNSTVIPSPPGRRDLIARFEYFRVSIPCPAAGCGEPRFRRGDANADGELDLSDALRTLLSLFGGGAALPCPKSADSDDSGTLELTDVLSTLTHLFLDGPPPGEPHGSCGTDPTPDALPCGEFPPCP